MPHILSIRTFRQTTLNHPVTTMNDNKRKKLFGWQGMAVFIAILALLMWLLTILNPDISNGSALDYGCGISVTRL